MATEVFSYDSATYTLAFPAPDVTTTVSYWTGSYPTVTGPLPTEFQSLSLTTRTHRQTPLSSLPALELLTTPPPPTTLATTIRKRQATSTLTGVVQSTSTLTGGVGPQATRCGESGNFTLNFDEETVGGPEKGILPVQAVNNPYHHLFYSNGYSYVPDKWEPYPAISQPNVAMFMPLGLGLLPNTPFAGTLLKGELGAGPRASVDAYWFNAQAGWFGCALNGLTPCTLRISGFRWDYTLKQEVVAVEQTVTIPACYGYLNCRLTPVVFNSNFQGLSGIQFSAETLHLGIPQIFFMDDLQLSWYNNSCAAGILRIGHQ